MKSAKTQPKTTCTHFSALIGTNAWGFSHPTTKRQDQPHTFYECWPAAALSALPLPFSCFHCSCCFAPVAVASVAVRSVFGSATLVPQRLQRNGAWSEWPNTRGAGIIAAYDGSHNIAWREAETALAQALLHSQGAKPEDG